LTDSSPLLEGAEIVSRNPARPDDVVARFAPAGGIDVDRAVQHAAAAGREHRALPAAARAEALSRAADAVAADAADLSQLICREVGKPITEASGEVARAVAILRFFAQVCLDPEGESYPAADARSLLVTRRAPRGVVGLITPWNFPVAIPVWKLAPALAYGNACVWKPSQLAPACAARLGELLASVLPQNVVQLVQGDGETGSALVAHPQVAAVSFTGSERVGRSVAVRLAERGAAAQCEMGGQNAAIVLRDADLEAAATMVAWAAMGYAGQKCTATSRIICERPVYDAMRDAVVAAVEHLVVEHPQDAACQVGPLITSAARDAALAAVDRGRSAGGRVLAGGRAIADGGSYLQPTVIELEDETAELAQEEVFAPVCALLSADDAEHAAEIANGVRQGLSTAVYTRDLDRVLVLARALDTGLVRINQPTSGVDLHVPFGGEKASGYGPREQGRAAREFYTTTRTVLISPS
jgi:acyl-CoA reductase-like NAD-dependent aldehyde dehydrogenase